MSTLRSLLTPVLFVSVFLAGAGCSETASGPGTTTGTAASTQVGGKGAGGSTDIGDPPSSSTTSPGDSGPVKGGTTSSGSGDSSDTKGAGGTGSSEKETNSGGTGSSEKETNSGGTNSGKSSTTTKTTKTTTSTGGQSQGTTTSAKGGTSNSSSTTSGPAGGDGAGKGLTIYYIRHGEVVANTVPADQVTIDNADTLTDLGLSQIAALTTYLQGLGAKPDGVLVSPAKRTQKTIEPYLVAEDVQGEIWMELMECCNQTPTGAALPTEPEYIQYYKATIEAENLTFRDPANTKFWNTQETFEQGLFQVITAKAELLSRYGQSGKTIFVVGHAAAGQIMIGLLLGQDMTKGATTTGKNAVFLLNTGVMKLTQDPGTGAFTLAGKNMNNPATK